MRIKSTGIFPLELVGDITEIKAENDWLVMNLRTTTPAGWGLSAALTYEDLRTMLRLLMKPRNLKCLTLGFFKPARNSPPPGY